MLESRINDIMEQASQSLAQMDYLASETQCLQALDLARNAKDWRLYAAIVLPLQECRRQRRMIAADGWVRLGTDTLDDLASLVHLGPGCVVVTHPHNSVTALRLSRFIRENSQYIEVLYADNPASDDTWTLLAPTGAMVALDIPAPPVAWRDRALTTNESWPGPQPAKGIAPRPGDWFIDATEAFGNAAYKTVQAPLGTVERITQIEQAIDAAPDHEFLHQWLAQAARAMAKVD